MKQFVLIGFVLCFLGFQSASANSTNIRFNPLGMLVGYINANVDFKVGSSWTIGPEVGYLNWDFSDTSVSATKFGVRANFFLGGNAFEDGWYIGPFAMYVSAEGKDDITSDTAKATGTIIGALFGYGWFWNSFNMMLGLGFQSYNINAEATTTVDFDSVNRTGAAFEWTIGWAF